MRAMVRQSKPTKQNIVSQMMGRTIFKAYEEQKHTKSDAIYCYARVACCGRPWLRSQGTLKIPPERCVFWIVYPLYKFVSRAAEKCCVRRSSQSCTRYAPLLQNDKRVTGSGGLAAAPVASQSRHQSDPLACRTARAGAGGGTGSLHEGKGVLVDLLGLPLPLCHLRQGSSG